MPTTIQDWKSCKCKSGKLMPASKHFCRAKADDYHGSDPILGVCLHPRCNRCQIITTALTPVSNPEPKITSSTKAAPNLKPPTAPTVISSIIAAVSKTKTTPNTLGTQIYPPYVPPIIFLPEGTFQSWECCACKPGKLHRARHEICDLFFLSQKGKCPHKRCEDCQNRVMRGYDE